MGSRAAIREKGTKHRMKGTKQQHQPPDSRAWPIFPFLGSFSTVAPQSATAKRFFFIGSHLWTLWGPLCLPGE